jgi:hypothetical protein
MIGAIGEAKAKPGQAAAPAEPESKPGAKAGPKPAAEPPTKAAPEPHPKPGANLEPEVEHAAAAHES